MVPPFLLRGHHQLERHGQASLAAEAPLGAFRAVTDVAKVLSILAGNGFVCPDMFPVFGREVVKGQESVTVLDQLGDGFVPFHAIGFDEESKAAFVSLRVSACQISCRWRLCLGLHGFRHRIETFMVLWSQHLCSCVVPKPPAAPSRTQARRRRWRVSGLAQAAAFEVEQHLAPALGASRKPSVMPSSSLRPYSSAPTITRTHCFSSAILRFEIDPSAQM